MNDGAHNGCSSGEDHRRLATPVRGRSCHTQRVDRRSRSRSRLSERSHSRSQNLRAREQELAHERERVYRLERDLQRERDKEFERRHSESRSALPTAPPVEQRQKRSCGNERCEGRSGSRDDLHHHETVQRRGDEGVSRKSEHSVKRSCSPTFSSKDVLNLIRSIKGDLTSQPLNQGTQVNYKSFDSKNILPEFDPSTKSQRMEVWLKKVNECASVYGWDERTIIHFAMQRLRGLAKTWYESLSTILFTWHEWQGKLMSAFPCEQNYGQSLEDMLQRKSRFNEPIEKYYYEKLALLNNCDISGKRAVDCIIHGISDKTMKSSALALRCTVPEELLSFLLSNRDSNLSHQKFPFRNKGTSDIDAPERDQNIRTYPKSAESGRGIFCYNCKERGHPYHKCLKPLVKCGKCNFIGHKTETCPSKRDGVAAKTNDVQKTMCIYGGNTNDKFIKEVTVNEVSMEAFVDFGSEVTLIKESAIIKLGVQHDGTPSTMMGFGKGTVQSLGTVSLNLSVDGVEATVPCRVVEDGLLERALLIGQSYSEQPHVVVYKDATKLQFLDIGSEMPKFCPEHVDEPAVRVRVVGHSKLYGGASVKAATDISTTGTVLLETKVVGKPNEQYLVCGGVYQVTNGSLYVTVMPCLIPCLLQENAVFSRAEKIEVVNRIVITPDACKRDESNRTSPIWDEKQIRLGDAVADSDKARLVEMLERYEHCFARDMTDLGCTGVAEMRIEVNSERPVVYRPYRLSHYERDKVRDMVDEMLKAGIIRESVSNYASPIILVRKKDGNIRLCIDYRMLNSITVKERYPMPIIEDEIARLSGQAWFITLDLMSGYYQVPISEQSKHMTAFVTPDGHYEFNRMPFGLANAPAVFQRMMNHVLGPARFSKATVYIDDLLVFGKNPMECLDRLEEVLKLLEYANLKLNLSKCCFLENKIDYLGYEISSAGMRPGEAKIQSVANFPRPENVHGVRQFVGLVSYFRKFILGFAQLAYPLTKLLKKDVAWEWSDSQEEAFKNLKTKLVERPVLAIYDPSAETELHTDASRIGVGGILLQRLPGKSSFQPVAYYSRQTTPEEKNFHSYELETLAVVCALKKFRVFLLGKKFKIITDCSALRSTFQKRDIIPRIARWWLALQEFDCSVEYRPGTKMSHVDALSRNPITGETPDIEYATVMAISDDDWLLTLQLGDSELCRIRSILSSDLDSRGLQYIKENYVIRDNKLYRCLGGDKNNIRWVVPKGARWQLCRMNHDDIGHVGFEKTLERIKRNYWFSKMSRFVKKYVAACIECAYAKKSAGSKEGFLHPITKVEVPFHTLHVDHLGPFVKSKRGHTHIFVVVDSFTKFVFIRSVRNTKTLNVIKVLEDIFDIFRTPDRIVSDRGSCFTSHAFKRFCLDRGVKHILNAVASPRSNGQVERYNRTILNSLTAQNLRNNEKDWDTKLGKIQWGLNNTIQKTTGRAPAEVMFGTSINSEVNPVLNEIVDETRETCELSSLRREVKDKIDREQVRQKQDYDKKRKSARTYNHGDLVKITKTVFQNYGKSTKLLPSYEGPFRVIKVLGNERYKIAPISGFEGTKRKRKTTVAADRMQPWIHVAALEVDENNESDNDMADTMSDECDE